MWRWCGYALTAMAFLISIPLAQQSPQPQAEALVAQEFKAAAPDLFSQWLEGRPDRLKKAAVGKLFEKSSSRLVCRGLVYAEFLECHDDPEPTEYRIDVTRTDSILTPYLGHLFVHVTMVCTQSKLVAEGGSRGDEALNWLKAHCAGTSYEACVAQGAKPIRSSVLNACSPSWSLPWKAEVNLIFGWSEGKWEFQREILDPPLHVEEMASTGVRAASW